MKRKRVVVLGATGSIGESAQKVARDIPDRMEIVGLAANVVYRLSCGDLPSNLTRQLVRRHHLPTVRTGQRVRERRW